MPLVRFEVRNEYRLGQPQLYKQTNPEDPKAVLDGVAVAGLVGILRQLGDLAEFAGEVFHGLQEQVMSTASRSHKLLVRVQNIEGALPSLEKAVLSQTSHIHFAYTAGSKWHSRIQNGQHHFIYNDLPRFIMDSYEECRDPPRVHLLDKFDTGGPGSCLKRYSDPTFFRRASGNFKEPDVEKIPKEKKARKNKKKGSSQRNVDFLCSASMPNQSGRMQFTNSTANGRTSSSHTTSTNDMAIKSDLGDHSNSFDSRTGSASVKCVFYLNSSAQSEEQEPKEFSSRLMHHNDVADSILSNEQTSSATEKFHHNSSPEPIVPISCDTWDEKEEIMEPKGLYPDGNEAPDMVTTDSDLGIQDEDIANFKNPDGMDVEFDDENIHKLSNDRNEFDEVESETENYMDALNTIESESENDLDCLTKHELKQFSSNADDEQVEVEVNKEMEVISDNHPSKYESHISSDISSDNEMANDLPTSSPSNSPANENNSHISGGLSNSENLPDTESSTSLNVLDGLKAKSVVDEPLSSGYTDVASFTGPDALDGSKAESVVGQPSSSGYGISNLMEPLNGSIVSSSSKSEESQAELSCIRPVSFWTNGGLLGLEPSKPPDFAVSNTLSLNPMTKSKVEVLGPPNDTSTASDDGERWKPGSVESIPSSRHEGQDAEVDKASDFHHGNRISDVSDGLNRTCVAKPRNELPLNADVKAETSQENDENPSQMFGLGHRLLINGFRRKMSLAPDSKHEEFSLLKADALEQSNEDCSITYHTTPEKAFNEKFGLKSSLGSLTSSPPLEYMKISFHPIDGFEASKLNLKFPDCSHSNGIIRDMFPSFQLVPEPVISLQDAGSDSDDDTFCRSSPYMSDDCLSHRSDSDSEQWESGESPENKNHELYDALCRKSSAETVSGSQRRGEMSNNGFHINSGLKSVHTENGGDPSFSSLLDLPSFDVVNPVLQGKSKDNLDHDNLIELQYPKESNTSPPPPPPVQWWVSKSASNVAEDKQNKIFEADEHVDLKFQGLTVCQQQKPAPANEQRVDKEAVAFKPKSKQDHWKLNVQKEANLPANGKGMDEKDDFFHQIKTKSFTLRRTVTAKPTFSSGPAANDKVTAILEKANAIRQAVGSDDGEDDDSWSDT